MEREEQVLSLRMAVENELRRVVRANIPTTYPGLGEILTYHMGWDGFAAGLDAQGKRVRPLLTLLCAEAAGGDWQMALPAAAAVELVHNFSLIHDDIQDQSVTRRGRETVWVKWGIAKAINAGDLMFTLAFTALQDLRENLPSHSVLDSVDLLQNTCVMLTGGQHLDLSFEKRRSVSLDEYWRMIEGKTAALMASSCQLGAVCAQASAATQRYYREFGRCLGLAFQIQDDYLGIWGNPEKTGKSIASDLVAGKKSLPVVYALDQGKKFANRWLKGNVMEEEVTELAALLEQEGAREFTLGEAARLTQESMQALEQAEGGADRKEGLRRLADSLLGRDR